MVSRLIFGSSYTLESVDQSLHMWTLHFHLISFCKTGPILYIIHISLHYILYIFIFTYCPTAILFLEYTFGASRCSLFTGHG